ncbi:MAG: tripartite tricarboxylate transporter substrate binding protein [Chloroflexota bacterium]
MSVVGLLLVLLASACGGAPGGGAPTGTAPTAAATAAATAAEAYPTRPITLSVGFAPGGGADVFSRALAEAAKGVVAQPIQVENRGGAGGTTASAYVKGQPADGYTLLFGHAGSTILTPTIAKTPELKWDAFEPVARIHAEEEILLLRPDSRWKTLEEVVAFAKANPGQVRAGGSALGGIDSFVILSLEKAAGIDVTYVPFDGGGPALRAFLSKDIDVLVGNLSDVGTTIDAKTAFPFAVASDKRSPVFPDVPTLKEKGWDVVFVQWRSIFAPKGTPAARLNILADGFRKALDSASWKSFRERTRSVDLFLGPAEFRTFLQSEDTRFTAIIKELGL